MRKFLAILFVCFLFKPNFLLAEGKAMVDLYGGTSTYNKNKIQYLYLLTPKGISEKTKLTINFLKKRAEEYNKLKQEMKSDG